MTFLDIRELQMYYDSPRGPVRAVDGISFSIDEPGEAVGIVGESGSGKTSLALALMRLLPPNVSVYEGTMLLSGNNLTGLSDSEFRS